MTVKDQQANSLHAIGKRMCSASWHFWMAFLARYAFVSDAVSVFAVSLLLISERTSQHW